jgi:thioredoxin 1
MTREVYADRNFIRYSRSQIFMRVFQDTDAEGERLSRRFNVRGYPTIIVLDSTGKEVGRILGARSTSQFIEELELIFESVSDNGRPKSIPVRVSR